MTQPGTGARRPTATLPVLHAAWVSRVVDGALPAETRATCDRCAMCSDVDAGVESFNPETKCCTYLPALPNFLVGEVLEDDDPAGEAGRASVRARIAAGVAVTPLGLGIPPSYAMLYAHGGRRVFGHARTLRCPHYVEEGGRCGIWRHRNAVCSTWFCKHERGAAGWSLWDSVRELLSAIEAQLARACLLELDLDDAALARTLPSASSWPGMDRFPVSAAELDGRADADAACWGAWAGRASELYGACARYVRGLDPDDVLARCGPEVQLRARLVRAAWQRLQAAPARRLRAAPLVVLGGGPDTCRVMTYSVHDPLEMPRALLDALSRFDGRPHAAVRAELARGGGPRLTGGLVARLTDFGLLVDAEEAPRAAAPAPPPARATPTDR